MAPVVVFAISGILVILLPMTKAVGEKRGKPLLIFDMISRGDIYVRNHYHKSLNLYSEWKDRVELLFKKQLKLHSKNTFNKSVNLLKKKHGEYMSNMRDSKLLKKPDGLSEFFKNMSDIERGNGEINDTYLDIPEETIEVVQEEKPLKKTSKRRKKKVE